MSQFFDRADEVKELLDSVEGLQGIPFIVDRQKDVISELTTNINKQAGALGIITWTGGRNIDESADGPAIESTFTVTLFTKPVLRAGQQPADDLVQLIACTLHDNRLGKKLNFQQRIILTGIEPVVSEELLAYRISIKTTNQF